MWKKIAIAGAVGAAILGTGAAALAETGTSTSAAASGSTPSASSSTSPSTGSKTAAGKDHLKGKLALALKRFEHGSWVSNDGTTGPVTHDAIKGSVSAVSATSITVKATDGTSETFVVDSGTAVRVKGTKGKAAIGSVKVNDTVLVTGTKSGSTDTAKHILDGGAK